MKIIKAIVLAVVLFSIPLNLRAEEEQAPPGMEIIKIGNVNYIVPEGTKVRKQEGGIIKLEGRLEYVARRFSEMEEKIAQIEKENETLKEKLKNIEESISKEKKTDKTDKDG
ncbi:MAG: hypothetical protein K9L87_02440 [Candidatus Omnitrophica bacterium]|nr:hypothetical protein [Candidatus Omnitrophota bacterium]MCF7892270.1 hypothetical protein [Candidatus Omnitrophota bacterium]MCF7897596.1 hypothetical protein [Candidatus Omnitrophota bacterium]